MCKRKDLEVLDPVTFVDGSGPKIAKESMSFIFIQDIVSVEVAMGDASRVQMGSS